MATYARPCLSTVQGTDVSCTRFAIEAKLFLSSVMPTGAGGAVALGRKRLHQLGVAGPFDFQLGGQGVNQGVRGGCSGRVGWLAGRFAGVLQGVGDGRGGKVIEKIGVPVS